MAKTVLVGTHKNCGGNVVRISSGSSLMSFYQCEKCTCTSANGTLRHDEIIFSEKK